MTVQTDRPPTGAGATGRPTFRMFDMVLFSVAAMLLLSQLTVTAAVGPTAIFWTVAIIIVFFVPYGLVTSELGSAYPDAGGIYAWVVRAFGNRWRAMGRRGAFGKPWCGVRTPSAPSRRSSGR